MDRSMRSQTQQIEQQVCSKILETLPNMKHTESMESTTLNAAITTKMRTTLQLDRWIIFQLKNLVRRYRITFF